jgi:hypothetical protein
LRDLLVTVYTQFGYASVDLDKYKDDSHLSKLTSEAASSEHSSPEKQVPQQEGGGIMAQNHDSGALSTSSGGGGGSVGSGERLIEL